MSNIKIQMNSITSLSTDCIVNAANTYLAAGGGVCGAIFEKAGFSDMTRACEEIGHCDTGDAVITPGFDLKAKYVIHAVGPKWKGGNANEKKMLYSAYHSALKLAKKNGFHSIGFPLISSGIYGYPRKEAWEVAIDACHDFIKKEDYDIDIIFAVLDSDTLDEGNGILNKMDIKEEAPKPPKAKAKNYTFFWHEDEENGCFSQWFKAPFVIEGITYLTCEQYMMAKKALLFEDMKYYFAIMAADNPKDCKRFGKQVRNFDQEKWDACKEEIIYRANYAKFTQNEILRQKLLDTGDSILAEASPHDKVYGIGLEKSDPDAKNMKAWKGQNLLGNVLMVIRKTL